MKLSFRELISNDIDACLSIVKEIYTKENEKQWWNILPKDLSDVLNKAYPSKCLVATIKNSVVGFGCYVKIDEKLSTPNIYYKLTWINMLLKYHGNGIGKKLVTELESHIRSECKESLSVILETDKPVFYEKLGYERYGKNGDNDLMQKVIHNIHYPKILVGTLFSDVKDYAIRDYFKTVCSFTYKNFDFCAVDNSPNKKYHKKIFKYFSDHKKKSNIGKLTVLHTPRVDKRSDVFMAFSANELRRKFLEGNYDALLYLECDIHPLADIIERLMGYNKPVISALYFTGDKSYSYPMMTGTDYFINEPPRMRIKSYIEGFFDIGECSEPKEITSSGLGCCFPSNTKILDENRKLRNIEDIKIGDKILTHTSNIGKVINTINRHYEGKAIEIIPKYFRKPILVTPEHPILIVKKNKLKTKWGYYIKSSTTIPSFIMAENVESGDYVCYPKYKIPSQKEVVIKISDILTDVGNITISKDRIFGNHSYSSLKPISINKISKKYNICRDRITYAIKWHRTGVKVYGLSEKYKNTIIDTLKNENFEISNLRIMLNNNIKINEDFCTFYGYYIAEGSSSNGVVCFSFGKTEMKYAIEIKNLTKKIFDLNSKIKVNGSVIEVYICSKILCDFMINISGKGAYNKSVKLINELILSGKKNIETFLKAYINGDGHERKEFTSMCTISETLAHELKEMFLILGKIPTISTRKVSSELIQGRKCNVKPAFILSIYNNQKSFRQDENYYYIPVSIKNKQYTGSVYNIEVENENTYCTESFAVHNCLIHKSVLEKIKFRHDIGHAVHHDGTFAIDLVANGIQNMYVPIMCRHDNQTWDVQQKMIGN